MRILKTGLQLIGAFGMWWWMSTPIVIKVLLGIMIVDVATGFLQAYVTKTLSSSTSFVGIARKIMILMLITMALLLEQLLAHEGYTIPLLAITGGFYIVHEGLSVLENMVRAGLPIPDQIANALKLVDRKQSTSSLQFATPSSSTPNGTSASKTTSLTKNVETPPHA